MECFMISQRAMTDFWNPKAFHPLLRNSSSIFSPFYCCLDGPRPCSQQGCPSSLNQYIIAYSSPISKIFLIFPLFPQNYWIFPHFLSIYVFCFPYFDHDAFTHHAFHVLDALGFQPTPPSCKDTPLFPVSQTTLTELSCGGQIDQKNVLTRTLYNVWFNFMQTKVQLCNCTKKQNTYLLTLVPAVSRQCLQLCNAWKIWLC